MVKSWVTTLKIWSLSALLCSLAVILYVGVSEGTHELAPIGLIILFAAYLVSAPALLVLLIGIPYIRKMKRAVPVKFQLLHLLNFMISLPYGAAIGVGLYFLTTRQAETYILLYIAAGISTIFLSAFLSSQAQQSQLAHIFSNPTTNQAPNMDNFQTDTAIPSTPSNNPESNKIMLKGIVTAILIICLLIPTMLISDLVQERQARQAQIAGEVSSKWADSQTLSGPFINLPYRKSYTDRDGKNVIEDLNLMILPENLNVAGKIDYELRQRSIYKVLLYRAGLSNNGDIILHLPKEIDPASVQWQSAKICFALSDFKGIEEKMVVKLNGVNYELSPGLPNSSQFKGLSALVPLSALDLDKSLPFQVNLKLKGSEQLHFLPLAGNSIYSIQSTWPSPSFDGYVLPTEREVTEKGFSAKWKFNKANLPFPTYLTEVPDDLSKLAFGVTLLQPSDGYAKTNRCVKYGILFIGLTLSLFFVIELMQKKPLHPVQYALIGLALVIFYTLLLSISEFLMFDYAYAIAALATISLISLYARSHFNSRKSMFVFGSVLTALYGFIFVLIQLEDTALLIGSIGLFLILALVMFASRRINWYGKNVAQPAF